MNKQTPHIIIIRNMQKSIHKQFPHGIIISLILLFFFLTSLLFYSCGGSKTEGPIILRFLPSATGGGTMTDSNGRTRIDPLRLTDGTQADIAPDLGLLPTSVLPTDKDAFLVAHSEGESGPLTCVFINHRASPGSNPAFRHAVSLAIDRAGVVERCMVPLIPANRFAPSTLPEWDAPDSAAPAYDPTGASAALDAAGYLPASGTDGKDDDTGKARLDPSTGKPLAIRLLTPTKENAPSSWETGRTLASSLNDMGVPTAHIALPDALLTKATMQRRAFDLLVSEVILAQRPFGLYPMLHSSRDKEWTNAFSGLRDHELDTALKALWSGNDELSAQNGSRAALSRISELLPYIPVCTQPNRIGLRGIWQVSVPLQRGNDDGGTWAGIQIPAEEYTSSGEGVLTLAAAGGLHDLNPLTAHGADEWRILRMLNMPLLEASDGPGLANPVLAEKWEIGEWIDADGLPRTKITLTLRSGLKWQDGIDFNAYDIAFMINTIKKLPDANFHSITNRIEEVKVTDDRTLAVWFNDLGCRCLYDLAWFSLLPEHIWKETDDLMSYRPWEKSSTITEEMTGLVGTGIWRLNKDGLIDGRLEKGVSLERIPKSESLLRLLESWRHSMAAENP